MRVAQQMWLTGVAVQFLHTVASQHQQMVGLTMLVASFNNMETGMAFMRKGRV